VRKERHHFFTFITIPAFGLLYVLTAFSILAASIMAVLGRKRSVDLFTSWWARSTFRVLGKKLHIDGRENMVEGEKYILLANHSSLFDIMAIMSFCPGVAWFGREYLLKVPVMGYLLKKTGYIPMKTANFRNTKGMVEQLVRNGDERSIAIFPEGTRTEDGKINRFHRGFIYVLKASKLDVLPVTLNGFYSFKPKNRFSILFSSRISAVIHKPVKNEELITMSDQEIINILKEVIESANYH